MFVDLYSLGVGGFISYVKKVLGITALGGGMDLRSTACHCVGVLTDQGF